MKSKNEYSLQPHICEYFLLVFSFHFIKIKKMKLIDFRNLDFTIQKNSKFSQFSTFYFTIENTNLLPSIAINGKY